ncbi:IS1634 family transposase, partial [Schleiferilactobacillus shenzhenensis]|uniref:IS1634 family transposase n=1 Tax=Schleiferilactobacillus shenzhenensis TaxID=1231337 RepID=UPI00058BB564
RILYPSSKRSSWYFSRTLLETPDINQHHMYRALSILAEEADTIEQHVYETSKTMVNRDSRVLYYDCTNFYFEIGQADGLRQFGVSKENRPNPIVQMGMFMDGSEIPLSLVITPGNTNEQTTLKPLEKKILREFHLSQMVVCTDAGLSSTSNRLYNHTASRAFITTQSIKKLQKVDREWALDTGNWSRGTKGKDDWKTNIILSSIPTDEAHYDTIYYKERWVKIQGLEQRLIVSFSPKYQAYQRAIRAHQIKRALKNVENPASLKKKRQNDPKRFLKVQHFTDNGEVAGKENVVLDEERIAKEAQYDGFYAVCTDLKSDAGEIVQLNHRRWMIEDSFRIMKSEFKARPVYVRTDHHIEAHFLTCFLALLVFRILENMLDHEFTCEDIIDNLRDMKMRELPGEGYVPEYVRNDFTDKLHDVFGFRTDMEVVTKKNMKNILKQTKVEPMLWRFDA